MEAKTTPAPKWFSTGMALGIIMLIGLLYSMYNILVVGHTTMASSEDVPWNILVVYYAFGISSIGMSFVASLGLLLGFHQFDALARRSLYLAFFLGVAAVGSIVLDMGQPLHAIWLFLSFHETSPLARVAVAINLYLVFVAIEVYLMIKKGHNDPSVKTTAVLTIISAIVAHSSLGSIFGMQVAKDMWYGPYYPLYFLLSAFLASAALIVPVIVYTYKFTGQQISPKLETSLVATGKLLIGLLVITLIFAFWKIHAGTYAGKAEYKMLLSGAYAFNFWVFEILLGFVLPLIMLPAAVKSKNLNTLALASLIAVVGLFVSRYDFVVIGQLIPSSAKLLSGQGIATDALMPLAKYSPNLVEILAGVGLLGFVWTGYVIGMRYLPLDEDEK